MHYLHPLFFQSYIVGVPADLRILDESQRLDYMDLHRSAYMVEPELSVAFLNTLLSDTKQDFDDRKINAVTYYLNLAYQARPLSVEIIQLYQMITPTPELASYLDVLVKMPLDRKFIHPVQSKNGTNEIHNRRKELLDILHRNPAHINAALKLLDVDKVVGVDPSEWLTKFICPRRLLTPWQMSLFFHYAKRGWSKKGLELWDSIPSSMRRPYALTLAGDMFMLEGDQLSAVRQYTKALSMDPKLTPVRMRLDEISSPQIPRPELSRQRSVAICIFSWNNAQMLKVTLGSLAESDLGNATIHVLLNGCSDDSRSIVENSRRLFPNNTFEIIDLPVNVGVAPARNWLLQLPTVHKSDYVVFADDDIMVPADWLSRYLTCIEDDPQIGVVGPKAVSPPVASGEAPRFQYLYRFVSVGQEGVFKLSLSEPGSESTDTGLYTFVRQVQHVMGCLILLRNSILREVGAFDIRYNPSQVEDLDHDLATCLAGYKVVYCGTVQVIHYRKSSDSIFVKKPALWSSLANHLKMSVKFEEHADKLLQQARELTNGYSSTPRRLV
jgi:GT2 family glycosyltransferase